MCRGARIHSDSWGASTQGAYDYLSQAGPCCLHQDYSGVQDVTKLRCRVTGPTCNSRPACLSRGYQYCRLLSMFVKPAHIMSAGLFVHGTAQTQEGVLLGF